MAFRYITEKAVTRSETAHTRSNKRKRLEDNFSKKVPKITEQDSPGKFILRPEVFEEQLSAGKQRTEIDEPLGEEKEDSDQVEDELDQENSVVSDCNTTGEIAEDIDDDTEEEVHNDTKKTRGKSSWVGE